jgi:uncharacterized protein
LEIFGYIASVAMGLTLGMIGGGGSILTVPILVYLFAAEPLLATSESLFVVGSTALLGGLMALRAKEARLKTVFQFALPSFVGVYLMKQWILPSIPEEIFQVGSFHLTKALLVMLVFAILMLLASLSMIRRKNKANATSFEESPNAFAKIMLQGFFVGNVTGLVGAGGGFLIVPALVNLLGLNMKSAVGSSLLIIAANSLFGFAVAMSSGLLPTWDILIVILALSLVGLVIGRYFAKSVSDTNLKKSFGYFVLVMGTLILLDQIHRL